MKTLIIILIAFSPRFVFGQLEPRPLDELSWPLATIETKVSAWRKLDEVNGMETNSNKRSWVESKWQVEKRQIILMELGFYSLEDQLCVQRRLCILTGLIEERHKTIKVLF